MSWLQRYQEWLEDEVGFIIDPMDDVANWLLLRLIAVVFFAYVVFGWFFIVTVLTPIVGIISFVKRLIR